MWIDYSFSASHANCSTPSTALETTLTLSWPNAPLQAVNQMAHVLLIRLQYSNQPLLVVQQVDLFLFCSQKQGMYPKKQLNLVYDIKALIKQKCSCSYQQLNNVITELSVHLNAHQQMNETEAIVFEYMADFCV